MRIVAIAVLILFTACGTPGKMSRENLRAVAGYVGRRENV